MLTDSNQSPLPSPELSQELEAKWGEDVSAAVQLQTCQNIEIPIDHTQWAFSGIATFGHLDHFKCLTHPYEPFDIGVIGAPFDTAVSYRPGTSSEQGSYLDANPKAGARMGPRAIRTASARHLRSRGFNVHGNLNPYASWAKVIDCGDIPITPFDNAVAVHQMTEAYRELAERPLAYGFSRPRENTALAPRLVTLGGDHLVALPALRALRQKYGQPLVLLHFDSHLDSLHPDSYPSAWSSDQTQFNHGSVFWQASTEGLISNVSSVHAGINTRLTGADLMDFINDDRQGFLRVSSDAIDEIGAQGLIDIIRRRIGTKAPVYLSIDIDVLDPGFAPGKRTPS